MRKFLPCTTTKYTPYGDIKACAVTWRSEYPSFKLASYNNHSVCLTNWRRSSSSSTPFTYKPLSQLFTITRVIWGCVCRPFKVNFEFNFIKFLHDKVVLLCTKRCDKIQVISPFNGLKEQPRWNFVLIKSKAVCVGEKSITHCTNCWGGMQHQLLMSQPAQSEGH